MKAYKRDIEMRCRDVHVALETMKMRSGFLLYETLLLPEMEMGSVDESVAVEFGTIDNLGDNQFRYKYDSMNAVKCRTLSAMTYATDLEA